MSDDNPKKTPYRVESQQSDESGYFSIPASPGMQVSIDFRGICKKKVRQNFGYIKLEIVEHIDLVITEVQAFPKEVLNDNKFYELNKLPKLEKTESFLKHLIRKGEECCKYLLHSFQSDNIESSFILYHLYAAEDKKVIHQRSFSITSKDIQTHCDLILEELEITDVLDPLFEYYLIGVDHHDSIVFECKTSLSKNKKLVQILLQYTSNDWIPGFVHVLENNKHAYLLSQIKQESGYESRGNIADDTSAVYEMSIRFTGINAPSIQQHLIQIEEIDDVCRRFAKLSISSIRHGSILLMVHPITPDTWKSTADVDKQELLIEFIRQLLDTPDVKNLIRNEIDVTIEIKEVKNVFGDPAWRVSQSSNRSTEEQRLCDNWTFITEELEVNKLMNYLVEQNKMTVEERRLILNIGSRMDKAKQFLRNLKGEWSSVKVQDMIKGLKATRQTDIAKRLEDNSVCIECLREKYKKASNYKLILDEMVSSIMQRTVDKFDDGQIPYHIKNILTPACGRPRRDRAHLFMQYVLLNDDVLRSFENVLSTTHFVDLDKVTCSDCTPGTCRDSFSVPSHLIEDDGKIQCSFTVKLQSDNSLSITMSTHQKKPLEKTVERPLQHGLPSEPFLGKTGDSLNITMSTHPEKPLEKPVERPLQHGLPSEPFLGKTGEHSAMVIAIDFGTTYSGFAFSVGDKKEKIFLKKWHGTSSHALESSKTPTTILLTPDKQFAYFGYEAEEKYQDLFSSNDHTKWHYFNHFKMELHSKKDLTRKDTFIQDAMGNKLPAFDIFKMSISYLKKEAEKLLMEKGYRVSPDVRWVITVPAIWSDAAKQFMREASEQASIRPKNLMLALEPEVASVYFRGQFIERSSKDTLTTCSPGTRFMIVDIGGGTTDITVMEAKDNNCMKQISMPSGGACGGEKINQSVFQFLNSVFGEDTMQLFKTRNSYDFQELSKDIEISKRSLKKGDKLVLTLPLTLIDMYNLAQPNRKLEDVMKRDKRFEIKRKTKLYISSTFIESVFSEVISKIITYIEATFKETDNISIVVVVGGFAECPLLKEELKKRYSTLVIPNEADLAVLKGAVMYGHDPCCVAMRKCQRTYGTKVVRAFLQDDLPEKRIKEGGNYCKDVFNKVVEIGKCIGRDETRTTEIQPLKADMAKMPVKLYCSTDPNPRYVTDETCTLLGEIVVDIPRKYRSTDTNVIVSMTFGQTEITVEGKVENSNEAVTTVIDFLSSSSRGSFK